MTVYSVANAAAIELVSSRIPALFTSDGTLELELSELVNDVAIDIAKSHDWRELTRIAEFAGNGSQTVFPRPADFDRMLASATVDDKNMWFWGYFNFATVNEWMLWKNAKWGAVSPGGWILMADGFTFQPAPTDTATFPYISKLIVRSDGGELKSEFTSDDDTFLLDERLLRLGVVWRWKAMKGLDYSEELQSYELALSQAQARDSGAQQIRSFPRRWSNSFSYAYTGTVI